MERLKPYPAYRDSGISWLGKIPKHWEVSKLKFIADVCPSNVNKKTDDGEASVRLCNYVDVYYNERITSALDFMQASATPEERAKFQLRAGDVCVTKDSEEWSDIAVPAFVVEDIPDLLCGYHLAMARPKKDRLTGAYLARAFGARGINEQFQVEALGITRYGLGQHALINGVFPVPPLDEQRAMAEFLDRETERLDALMAKKEQLIALLLERRSTLISHAVTKGLNPNASMRDTGIPWLGKVPKHWEVKRLKYMATVLRGKFTHRPRTDPSLYDGKYPFIQTGDVASANKYINEHHQTLNEKGLAVSQMFPKGTMVMTIAANIGDTAILNFDACFPDSIVGFFPKRGVNLEFLFRIISAMKAEMMSTAVENTQLNLNVERIVNLHAMCPPESEQTAIADYLDRETGKIDALISRVRDGITALREYRTALISAVVSGKIAVDAKDGH